MNISESIYLICTLSIIAVFLFKIYNLSSGCKYNWRYSMILFFGSLIFYMISFMIMLLNHETLIYTAITNLLTILNIIIFMMMIIETIVYVVKNASSKYIVKKYKGYASSKL